MQAAWRAPSAWSSGCGSFRRTLCSFRAPRPRPGLRGLVSRRPITVVPAGADHLAPVEPGPRNGDQLLFVGRLVPQKGVSDIIDAVALVHERGRPCRVHDHRRGPRTARAGGAGASARGRRAVRRLGLRRRARSCDRCLACADPALAPRGMGTGGHRGRIARNALHRLRHPRRARAARAAAGRAPRHPGRRGRWRRRSRSCSATRRTPAARGPWPQGGGHDDVGRRGGGRRARDLNRHRRGHVDSRSRSRSAWSCPPSAGSSCSNAASTPCPSADPGLPRSSSSIRVAMTMVSDGCCEVRRGRRPHRPV